MTAFVANTNVLDLIGLKSEIADAFINDATVTVTIKDGAGTNVTGATWPLAMDYVDESDGDYRAILAHALNLVPATVHTAIIDANGGTNRIGHWEFPFVPATRT